MPKDEKQRRVVMERRVAKRWILAQAHEHHAVTVLYQAKEGGRRTANFLRAFRDGKASMKTVPTIPDLGIEESFDGMHLWSSDREALAKLANWFEKRGYETTGVW